MRAARSGEEPEAMALTETIVGAAGNRGSEARLALVPHITKGFAEGIHGHIVVPMDLRNGD